MTWITDNKDSGPWEFTEQGDKFGYLNNAKWSTQPKGAADSMSASEFCEEKDIALDSEETHKPCGHWHKRTTEDFSLSDEYVFIVDSAGHIGGIEDVLIKKEKNTFPVLDWQGGKGTGIEKYYCPRGCCVDEQYVWVADFYNNRMMVRNKFDLTYVNSYGPTGVTGTTGFSDLHDVAVDDLYTYDTTYGGGSGRLRQRLKTDPTTIIKNLNSAGSVFDGDNNLLSSDARRANDGFYGVDIDETYIYLCDFGGHRILKLLKSDFSFVASWGYGTETFSGPVGIDTDGTYIYVADYNLNQINKIEIADPTNVTIGDSENPLDFEQPLGVAVGNTHLYVCEETNQRIQKILANDMSYVSMLEGSGWESPRVQGNVYKPVDIAVEDDESYLYVADLNHMVTKFDADFNFVTWSGDPTGDTDSGENAYYLPSPVCIDDTYLYINDLMNGRIVKRLKSDLSYVSEYDFSSYAVIESDVDGLSCDGTYVYALCVSGNRIHRIAAATMTYVDGNCDENDSYIPRGCCLVGTDLYITDWGLYRGVVGIFDTTNLAGGLQSSIEDGYIAGNYVLNNPYSIIVDSAYAYVANSIDARYGLTTDDNYGLLKLNKTTGAIIAYQDAYEVDGIPTDLDYATHVAVDENYVFLTERKNGISVSVYNKSDLSWVYTDIMGITGQYCYPWGICIYYDYSNETYDDDGNLVHPSNVTIDSEPQVWPM
jgi:hypothetical protein